MSSRLRRHSRILRACKDHETLLASTLYLMTRYLQHGNTCLHDAITAHLLALADHPRCPNACLAATARRLGEEWLSLQTSIQPHTGYRH